MSTGFIYDQVGYILEYMEWHEKPGTCNWHDEGCPLKIAHTGKGKCHSNLVGHCCKHVVRGYEIEKERYRSVTDQFGISNMIPSCIWNKDDRVVKNYENVSKKMLSSSIVSACGEGNNIRFLCSGQAVTDGMVTILSYEEIIGRYYYGHHEGSKKVAGIVSSFFNYISADIFDNFGCSKQFFHSA